MKFAPQHWNNLKIKYKIEREPKVITILQLILAKPELGVNINNLQENWLRGENFLETLRLIEIHYVLN